VPGHWLRHGLLLLLLGLHVPGALPSWLCCWMLLLLLLLEVSSQEAVLC